MTLRQAKVGNSLGRRLVSKESLFFCTSVCDEAEVIGVAVVGLWGPSLENH